MNLFYLITVVTKRTSRARFIPHFFNKWVFVEEMQGGEPKIPSENPPHPSVLVGGVRQRHSCALGWYRPSVGVPGT